VFSKNNPVLAFNDLANRTDLDEQEGMMHLFEGTVLAIRNSVWPLIKTLPKLMLRMLHDLSVCYSFQCALNFGEVHWRECTVFPRTTPDQSRRVQP
jgi:hypothetical protein